MGISFGNRICLTLTLRMIWKSLINCFSDYDGLIRVSKWSVFCQLNQSDFNSLAASSSFSKKGFLFLSICSFSVIYLFSYFLNFCSNLASGFFIKESIQLDIKGIFKPSTSYLRDNNFYF